jgi:hypothetical protein
MKKSYRKGSSALRFSADWDTGKALRGQVVRLGSKAAIRGLEKEK